MFQLSSIHEKQLTPFHRNQFIVIFNDLQNTALFRDYTYDASRFFSVEMHKRIFPRASQETIVNLLLTTLQIKAQAGELQFLVVYNDENMKESMDMLNGLLHIFDLLTPSSTGQAKQFKQLHTYAGSWTRYLIEEEKGLSRIGILLNK